MINYSTMYTSDVFTHYQPLYALQDKKLFGFESLLRSKANTPPQDLFDIARANNQVNILDKIAIKSGIKAYSGIQHLNDETLLFLNVLPSTLVQDDFPTFIIDVLESTEVQQKQIVLELSESVSEKNYWSFSDLKDVISYLRQQGIQFAIDDVGSGIACNQKIIEFEPEFVKLDKYFGMGLTSSKLKQITVQSYSQICRDNSLLILEGIESNEDLELAHELGVDIGQGFYLGKPGPLGT